MTDFLKRQTIGTDTKRKKAIGRAFLRIQQISLVVIVWSLFIGGIWGLYQLVFVRGVFVVKNVEVEGTLKNVSAVDVKRMANIKTGSNIFLVDMKKVQKSIENDPWTKEVAVARKIPSNIWIYVNEHRPYAILSSGALWLVSRQGVVFKELEGSDEKDLPVITGVTEEDLSNAMKVLDDYYRSPLTNYFSISEVSFDRAKGFTVIVSKYGFAIRLGFDRVPEKLELLYSMLGGISSYKTKMRYVDLNIPGKVVVKYEG
ncbi:MAG: hypothetical protein COV46_03235 [Deltaproteobacteria bacterium CG11_big_fil_rev_8_21_14_0_20_49_13]|nr:MAG: hypothetical protein COV46_03235 [Deltaproteobacteria bacterium CG11_big_fil_rev_8_21_14_0_20_49_13]